MLSRLRKTIQHQVLPDRSTTPTRARELLRQTFGANAEFRPGQLEAIVAIVDDRARMLVVQHTGWGKSLVYFLATRLLREQGSGPTLLLSPLLSLMRNQLDLAERFGVRAASLTSENRHQWKDITARLAGNEVDLLMISPERLANPEFRAFQLPRLQSKIGLLVVDEAHCISDWGHDFRPDYRRICHVVDELPSSTPVLATTATANTRVIEDVRRQLGTRIRVVRGPLDRNSLRLQTIVLPEHAQRLAWLATHLADLPGTGIIYCLTVRDTELVSSFLASRGFDAPAYHAELDSEMRIHREGQLLRNRVKALCATVALGMGFDKPDLGFVVHYQRPGSLVAYYQQIGRAGRSTEDAWVVLLCGEGDDHVSEQFAESAFPAPQAIVDVLHALERDRSISEDQLRASLNLANARFEQCLRFLEVEGAIVRDADGVRRASGAWIPDIERWRRVSTQRQQERDRIQRYIETRECLMQFVVRDLDDAGKRRCGRCANCAGDFIGRDYHPDIATDAERFLRQQWIQIEPRDRLPNGVLPHLPRVIDPQRVNEPGLALCEYGWTELGQLVANGKYRIGRFDDHLVAAASEAIRTTWKIDPSWWIVPVPSRRHPELVPDFAARVAATLGIACVGALSKNRETPEQKSMQTNLNQFRNVMDAFRVEAAMVRPGPVLLVDDMADSGWTFAVCGAALRRNGSGAVHPFALASQRKHDSV
jgi:ATP-dependent DNA helicase RecQ